MYKLNNILLSNFGILPGRAEASNIAIAGLLDMPARIGKTHHNWTGAPGVEPYVLAEEIRHGGRSIQYSGLLNSGSKSAALGVLDSFYNELATFDALVSLETPWGNAMVYAPEKQSAIHLHAGWIGLSFEFEQPIVAVPANLPAGNETQNPHIDGVALSSFGMFLSGFKDRLNRPKTKEQKFTAYENAGYQITPAGALDFEINLVAYAETYQELKTNIEALHALMAAPGMRSINIDGIVRQVFNVKGFKVSNLKVAENFAVCRITLPLIEPVHSRNVQYAYLADNSNNNIVTELEQLIKVQL